MTGRIVMILLVVLVGLAPLALGSNRPLPWAYNAAGFRPCCVRLLRRHVVGAAEQGAPAP